MAKENISREDLRNALASEIDRIYLERREFRVKYGDIKRSAIDTLYEKGLMEADALLEELDKIAEKKSTLSSRERSAAKDILSRALLRHMELCTRSRGE